MIRHHTRRAPRQNGGFSWGRFPIVTAGNLTGIEWRLFRRDHTGALHFHNRAFRVEVARADIANVIWNARRQLRELVDEIDLAALMQEAA